VPRADGCRNGGARDRDGAPAIVSYDLAEDSIWGLGIGCSGGVDIRIEPVLDDAITNAWLATLGGVKPGCSSRRSAVCPARLIVHGARSSEACPIQPSGAGDRERPFTPRRSLPGVRRRARRRRGAVL
jgi:hypothetical protein